jgi:hypothetical protein
MPTQQPKILWKVEFWEENREHAPVYVAYVMARTAKGAKNALKFRGFQQARERDKVWLSHLFYRDDILVTAKPDEQWAEKQKLRRDLAGRNACAECGSELDDDYCQECGWRRQASWLERAMERQGESMAGEEQ